MSCPAIQIITAEGGFVVHFSDRILVAGTFDELATLLADLWQELPDARRVPKTTGYRTRYLLRITTEQVDE